MARPVVGLALGGGAAKGYAHLGVLKVFEREKIPVDMISGTSIGSVFGALYASGLDLDLLIDFCCELKRNPFMEFRFSRMGLIKGKKVHALLELFTKGKTFDQLNTTLYIVAVNIESGRKEVFDTGSVAKAVRASIAIPGVFHPYAIDDKLYVDGAVLDRVPAGIIREKGAGIVIAVDVKMSEYSAGYKYEINNLFDIVLHSFDLMETEIAKHSILDADISIKPELGHIKVSDFDRAEECIRAGEEAAENAVPEIKKLLEK